MKKMKVDYLTGCTICNDGLFNHVKKLVDDGASERSACEYVTDAINKKLGLDMFTTEQTRNRYKHQKNERKVGENHPLNNGTSSASDAKIENKNNNVVHNANDSHKIDTDILSSGQAGGQYDWIEEGYGDNENNAYGDHESNNDDDASTSIESSADTAESNAEQPGVAKADLRSHVEIDADNCDEYKQSKVTSPYTKQWFNKNKKKIQSSSDDAAAENIKKILTLAKIAVKKGVVIGSFDIDAGTELYHVLDNFLREKVK